MCVTTKLKLHVEGSNETVRICGLAAEVDMQVVTSTNHIIKLWVFLLQQN